MVPVIILVSRTKVYDRSLSTETSNSLWMQGSGTKNVVRNFAEAETPLFFLMSYVSAYVRT